MKEIHVRVDEFLQCAMKTIKLKRLQNTSAQVGLAIAIEQGHVEVITHLCRANPSLVHDIEIEHLESTVFQLAIEHRQENIFSLIYKFDKHGQQRILSETDNCRNNMLHLVGNFSQHTQINHIRGAALQMQRELQWFKVRNFLYMYIRTSISNLL